MLLAIAFGFGLLQAAGAGNAAIDALLANQVKAWNSGDIPAFVHYYSDDCTFVGKQVLHGQSQLLARYQKRYSSKDAMGQLSFRNLQVQALNPQIAIAYGEWHIDRPVAAGGPVGGVFSLVLQQRYGAWRIVLDHTT